jgi:hypothetical protein
METNIEELEYRMYGFVPYNLSEIQKGIQFGHAVVEYGQYVKNLQPFEKMYTKWANHDKTFIILNGGTTNDNPDRFGSLNEHRNIIMLNGVLVASFKEPDLGDQLTAFVFLVDERVYNKVKYPDYKPLPPYWDDDKEPSLDLYLKWDSDNELARHDWIESIGGAENDFLREYLVGKRLA